LCSAPFAYRLERTRPAGPALVKKAARKAAVPDTPRPVDPLDTDFYLLDELLTAKERAVRDKVRAFSDAEVVPVINEYWEKAQFPFALIPKIAKLGIAGATIKGYGCPGMSPLAAGLMAQELSRGDGSISTFFGVHSGLAMTSIAYLGNAAQRRRWLPPMARMEKIGAFALTEGPARLRLPAPGDQRCPQGRALGDQRREEVDRERLHRGRAGRLGA